jgi:hypothetical protein
VARTVTRWRRGRARYFCGLAAEVERAESSCEEKGRPLPRMSRIEIWSRLYRADKKVRQRPPELARFTARESRPRWQRS